ncbi:hypothetical protein A6B43_06765 [Vespertiliibacter pulmonis]|uniref:Uncharacterized protein n=1 Tax=Vespertiliibacter pulmonis TaxID=1443036 RepID=A0A3N4VW68_9PAST|nr:hypothetical protein [Vespertiliibacter pulmonis]QLB21240.1 hypothetical protein A6B43_06765 [Vespertiliibacter pulmonis]RPE85643.1 hypothetical protein EDC46_0020 [Vespertiliibacter pulmonis]
MSDHQQSNSKLEIITFTILPLCLMLFIQMWLNYNAAPKNSIFISPYLLAFLVTIILSLIVLWKGDICPGQRGRLVTILPWLVLFSLGNTAYSLGFTPKHTPALLIMTVSVVLPFLLWKLPEDEQFKNIFIYCGLAMAGIAVFQYLLIYWYELPSLFNGLRANNFAQLLLGILLAGWYLVLAKSRLEGFLKLLVLLALGTLILNYLWVAFMMYQYLHLMPETPLYPFFIFFAVQFMIFMALAWLLLGKNIKNPTAWTLATGLAMLYPLTNIVL